MINENGEDGKIRKAMKNPTEEKSTTAQSVSCNMDAHHNNRHERNDEERRHPYERWEKPPIEVMGVRHEKKTAWKPEQSEDYRNPLFFSATHTHVSCRTTKVSHERRWRDLLRKQEA